jgi:hypothetical protein
MSASPGVLPPASLPVLGSGPDGFRWAIEAPGGPIPLKGVGLAAAAQEGYALLAPAPAGPLESSAANEPARASRRRPTPPRVRGALLPSPARPAVQIPSARRPRRSHLATAICLGVATLAAASALTFEGRFEVVGAAHLSGTLLLPALTILVWRALPIVKGLAHRRGKDS